MNQEDQLVNILELVSFRGRNGFRAIDRIRREVGLRLNDRFNFFSLDTLDVPLSPRISFQPKRNRALLDKINWLHLIGASVKKNFDIVHTCVDTTAKYYLLFRKLFSKKRSVHILTFHGIPFQGLVYDGISYNPSNLEKKSFKLSKKLIKDADLVTGVSLTTCKEIREIYDKDAFLTRDGVSTDVFKPVIKKHDTLTVLYVGSFQVRKRPFLLLKIAKKFPNIKFKIIGRGPLLNLMMHYSKKIRNIELITSTIGLSQLIKEYQESDIFFFPSITEGLANVLLEALSSGLPIIAARATSNHEVVNHGANGFLFSNLKEANTFLNELIMDENLRINMGKKSREIAINNYDWEKILPEHESVFKMASDMVS